MKFRPVYIYAILILVIIGLLVVFSGGDDAGSVPVQGVDPNGQMPDDDIHNNLGGKAPSSGNVSESFREKMKSLKDKYESAPSDTVNAREYARLLAASHQPEEAVEVYNNILTIDKNRTDIKFELATVYYSMGKYSESKKEIEEILAVDKNNIQAQYNLGAIEASLGNIEAAKKIWKELADDHPQTEAGKAAAQALESI